MNIKDKVLTNVEIAGRLARIREINRLATRGLITEDERLQMHNELEEGLGDMMRNTRLRVRLEANGGHHTR